MLVQRGDKASSKSKEERVVASKIYLLGAFAQYLKCNKAHIIGIGYINFGSNKGFLIATLKRDMIPVAQDRSDKRLQLQM